MPSTTTTAKRGNTGWWVALGVIIAAFVGTVITLNLTLYSASGFVGTYLSALEAKNADAALATPGVVTIPGVSEALLQRDALGDLADIELVEEFADGHDTLVRVAYTLNGLPDESVFRVSHAGMRLGLFNSWRFSDSPVSIVDVTPVNDPRFTANGIRLSTIGANEPGAWQVLTPAVVTLTHDSAYLTADTTTLHVTTPETSVSTEVVVRAGERFVNEVQSEVDAYLTECATQTVLFPTGCPFGFSVSNRLVSPPSWSIATFPVISIVPGDSPGEWLIDGGTGSARVQGQVQSLFDGSVSDLDETVDFSIVWAITVSSSDGVSITTG